MHMRFGRFRALALLAMAAVLGGCQISTKPGDDPDDDDSRPAGASDVLAQFIVVTPAELEFTHRVGGNDCPQLVGRIRVRNADTVRRTPVIVADSHLGFLQGSGLVNGVEVAIEPNQTVEIDVYFDCSRRTSFTSSVTVTTGGSRNGSVSVKGTVG